MANFISRYLKCADFVQGYTLRADLIPRKPFSILAIFSHVNRPIPFPMSTCIAIEPLDKLIQLTYNSVFCSFIYFILFF